jgi:hypothetical protein
MTDLNVQVRFDADGNMSIDFDRDTLLRAPLTTIMQEVAGASAETAAKATETLEARVAHPRPNPSNDP